MWNTRSERNRRKGAREADVLGTNMSSVSLSAGRGHRDCWKVVCSSLMGCTNLLSHLLFNCCPSKAKPWGMPERLATWPGCFNCWFQTASPKCVATGLVESVVGLVKTRLGWLSVCWFLSRFGAMPLVRAGHSALNSFFLKTHRCKFAWVALHNGGSSNVLLLWRKMQLHFPGGWVALCSKTLAGSDEMTTFWVAWIALCCTTLWHQHLTF